MGQVGFSCLESFVEINNMEECSSNSSKKPRRGRRRRPRRRKPKPAATPSSKSTWSPTQDSATSESSGMSETDASDTSETSSTSSVATQTRLHADLPSYNSVGGYVAHVVPCAPTVPHVPKENRRPDGLRPSEMRRRKYVVDSDLRESANFRANLRDTLEDTIEWRNDNDTFSVKDNGECLNLDEESGVRRSRRVRWIDHQNDQARKTEVQ